MGPAVSDEAHENRSSASSWSWTVCWLMFASTALSYMDRQAIALVGPQIRREFGVDFESFGWIIAAFGLSYALFQIPAGFVVDRFNVRSLYAGAVGLWSFAAMAGAWSPTLVVLIAFRALLGVGESFNWPCALRITREILPPRDRSLGNGIFNSGAAIGAVLTPLIVPVLARRLGWRSAFLMIGALGFAWVLVWIPFTRRRAFVDFAPRERAVSAPSSMRANAVVTAVVLASLAIVVAGALYPVPHRVNVARIRPTESLVLRSWQVALGSSVKRGAKLAVVESQGTMFHLISTREGRIARFRVQPGERIATGQTLYDVDDSLGALPVELEWVEPIDGVRFNRWIVTGGQTVAASDLLAHVRWGSQGEGDVLAPFAGRVEGSLPMHVSDAPQRDEKPLLTVYAQGYGSQALGLAALWWGVATLMVSLLLVGRLLPLDELGSGWLQRLGQITRLPRFWVLVVVSCTVNLSWHFLVNWLPTYLQTDRKMTYLAGGLSAALPFLAADVGNLGGGALSRWLGVRGLRPDRARFRVMSCGAALIACGAFVGLIPVSTPWEPLVIALLCLMALGAASYMANYFAFCQEVSAPLTGLVVGYLGGLGNLVAAGFSPVAGHLKDVSGSFSLVFILAGLAPIVGLLTLAVCWDRGASLPRSAPLAENA